MSFEGYHEYLCERGHRSQVDVYDDQPSVCRHPNCGARLAFWNMVDETNGNDPAMPRSMPAAVKKIGEEKRVIVVDLFAPDGPGWSPIAPREEGKT